MIDRSRAFKMGALFVFTGVLVGGGALAFRAKPGTGVFGTKKSIVTKEHLAQAFGDKNGFFKFPSEISIPLEVTRIGAPTSKAAGGSEDGRAPAEQAPGPEANESSESNDKLKAIVQYTFDPKLQESMEAMFRQYSPDYGAFVAMDAATGRVLAMVSYSRDPQMQDNLALRASFPSASVFKVVTAAAAIQERKFSADTQIQFSGANHTLYKSNILKTTYNRWTRHMSLKDAFGKSVNTVFGRLGAYTVGPEKLGVYAKRFGFNRSIGADLPMQEGRAPIGADAWDLAQTASGFTRENTMSPLQGALIAAAIANDGIMMEPYVVQSVHTAEGNSLYSAEPRVANIAVEPSTAREVRELMNETVSHGTSRKSFRGFFKGRLKELDVGGKTGSLTGMDPPGKYDWFVGYADGGNRRIAVAALTIHNKLWRVKSSYVARKAFENYFHDHPLPQRNIADARR